MLDFTNLVIFTGVLFVGFWILMKGDREKQRCFLLLIIYQYLEGLETLDLSKKTGI